MAAKIYLVSVLSADGTRYRVWGYYMDYWDARRVVRDNQTDIYEQGYYDFGLLTTIGEGPLAVPEAQEWFKAVYEDNRFKETVPVAIPEKFEQISYAF